MLGYKGRPFQDFYNRQDIDMANRDALSIKVLSGSLNRPFLQGVV